MKALILTILTWNIARLSSDYYFVFSSDVVKLKSIGCPTKDWEIMTFIIQGNQYSFPPPALLGSHIRN